MSKLSTCNQLVLDTYRVHLLKIDQESGYLCGYLCGYLQPLRYRGGSIGIS